MQDNNVAGISSANDLIQIMDIGNQLYSSLSWLARQACLMQSELPTALNVFDADYQLEYSESYSGTVHQEIVIEGYQFVLFSQVGMFNVVRITNSIKCVWYWLSTGIQWKLLWFCSPRNCYRRISVLYVFTKGLWVTHIQ